MRQSINDAECLDRNPRVQIRFVVGYTISGFRNVCSLDGQGFEVIELNRQAQKHLRFSELSIVKGATHLFEESGTLEEVSKQAVHWFDMHLQATNYISQAAKSITLNRAIEKAWDRPIDCFASENLL